MTTTLETLHSIDEVARMTGLTPRTLRFYEEVGLLDPPNRTEGGHRKYRDADVQRVERIKELKELLGYSLADLQTVLKATELLGTLRAAYHGDPDPAHRLAQVAAAYALISEQVAIVQSRIDRLTRVRDEYQQRQHRLEAERDRLQVTGATTHEEER
ncbi:MAG: helix-turn-helix domain-containing protein [Thermomicrobiales bacterium]